MLSIVYWNNTAWHCPVTVPGCILLAGAAETIHSQDAQSYIVFHWWLRGRDLEGEKYQQSQHSLTPQLKTFSVCWRFTTFWRTQYPNERFNISVASASISAHSSDKSLQPLSTSSDATVRLFLLFCEPCPGPALHMTNFNIIPNWLHQALLDPITAENQPFLRLNSASLAVLPGNRKNCPEVATHCEFLEQLVTGQWQTSRYGGSTKILSNIE